MLNQGGITKTTGTTRKIILSAPELAYTLSCKVANTGLVADTDGKKIVLAGTPLAGSLLARDTAFTVTTDAVAAPPIGVLTSDVDVTAGTQNATILVFGAVDESKLEASVVTALTSALRAALPKITFMK